jgi:hypothetical protein
MPVEFDLNGADPTTCGKTVSQEHAHCTAVPGKSYEKNDELHRILNHYQMFQVAAGHLDPLAALGLPCLLNQVRKNEGRADFKYRIEILFR